MSKANPVSYGLIRLLRHHSSRSPRPQRLIRHCRCRSVPLRLGHGSGHGSPPMTLALSQRTCSTQPQPNLICARSIRVPGLRASENRKVGGSTPPLATTELQVRWPLACGFVSRVERVPFLRPTVSDRDFARIAGSYRTSYRTELRSENSCHEMSKVSLPSHGRPSTHANLRLVRDHARAVLNCRADPDLEAKWRVWS